MLQTQKSPDVLLETTIYKPDGPGPFPLVVVSHGSSGYPRQDVRDQPLTVARYFLERGYMVAAPMRQGFSKSTGTYLSHNCDPETDALDGGRDIRGALLALQARPDVDSKHVVLVGQSHGGLSTLAASSLPLPGVRGTVIFAGVIKVRCSSYPATLIAAEQHFGRTSRIPSLWFYGANDHFIDQGVARSMASAYAHAGGDVHLVEFAAFKDEGHFLIGDPDGRAIWEPPLNDFLTQTGMPHDVTHPEYTLLPLLAVPPASNFAAIDDVAKVPLSTDLGRDYYRKFLAHAGPRAFAISGDGASGTWWGGRDNLRGAIKSCGIYAKRPCFLYAVDSTVVWDPKNVAQPENVPQQMTVTPGQRGWWATPFLLWFGLCMIFVLNGGTRVRNALDDNRRLGVQESGSTPASILVSAPLSSKYIRSFEPVSKTGLALSVAMIVVLVVGWACDQWYFDGRLKKQWGQTLYLVIVLGFGLLAVILDKLGYPLKRHRPADTAQQLLAKAQKNGYRRF